MRSSISIFTAGSWTSSSFSRWLLGQYATLIFLCEHTSILSAARFVGLPQSPHSVSPLNLLGLELLLGEPDLPSGEPESLSGELEPLSLELLLGLRLSSISWALSQTPGKTMGSWASSFVAISS